MFKVFKTPQELLQFFASLSAAAGGAIHCGELSAEGLLDMGKDLQRLDRIANDGTHQHQTQARCVLSQMRDQYGKDTLDLARRFRTARPAFQLKAMMEDWGESEIKEHWNESAPD